MSEQNENDDSVPADASSEDLVFLVKKIREQLVFLERKIDTLIAQSQERPVNREKHFSKPFRTYSPSSHHAPSRRDYASRGRDFDKGSRFEKDRPFEKRRDEEGQSFGNKRKEYDSSSESSFGKEGHYKKHYGSEKKSFEHKKKSFYHQRDDRR